MAKGNNRKTPTLFIRVDDVGSWHVDGEYLRPILDLALKHKLAVNLEIIPSILSEMTCEYLKDLLRAHENLIGIDQHGYSHKLTEFCGESPYEVQYGLIEKGRLIIMNMLGNDPTAFTPPEHVYTSETIEALNSLEFRVFSRQVKPTFDGKIFYFFGRQLKRYQLLGKRVSYHGLKIPRTELLEFSISVETSHNNVVKTADQVEKEILSALNYVNPVGILIHHGILDKEENLINMRRIIENIAILNIPCLTFEALLMESKIAHV